MSTPTPSGGGPESIDFLDLQIREFAAREPFDAEFWKSLRLRLSATPTTSLAEIVAKLRVVQAGAQVDADAIDLKILESAILDLETLIDTV